MVIEDFLIKNFAKMLLTVRVSTYLFLLFLYAYLLLVPRFINGELLVQSASGGFIPYIQKRQLLSEKAQTAPIQPSIPTTNIPSGVQQRPIFKR